MTKREFLAIIIALALALALFAACDRGGGAPGTSTDGETQTHSPAAARRTALRAVISPLQQFVFYLRYVGVSGLK